MPYKVFSEQEVEQFIEDGYVVLRNAFSPETAAAVRDRLWAQTGLDPHNPQTWTKPIVHLKTTLQGPEVDAAFTSRVSDAFDDLMGAGRWEHQNPHSLGWWPISFPGFHARPWQEPKDGWHVDGQQFHHHLNSRDQGLLPIFLLSDIEPGDGGTAIALGSHKITARVLRDAQPHGLSPGEVVQRVNQFPRQRVIETTGNAGDIAMMHPFMSHARSANTGQRVRFICNPCFALKEPMNLQRDNAQEYSPVEAAIVRALS